MTDAADVSRAARRLMAAMRTDSDARTTVAGVLARFGVSDLASLAQVEPEIVVQLAESFAEMDEDEEAMATWYREWTNTEPENPMDEHTRLWADEIRE